MSMDEYEKKFLELLIYVGFMKEEKVKVHMFLNGLPPFYKDRIQYDKPKIIEEAIQKAKHMYDQNKGRETIQNSQRDKSKDKHE